MFFICGQGNIRIPRRPGTGGTGNKEEEMNVVAEIEKIARAYDPRPHYVWEKMAAQSLNPVRLGKVYNIYQSAMHATRAEVYKLPYLDTVPLRKIKLDILNDDDNLPNGGAHHCQLADLFRWLGAVGMIPDDDFGSLGWKAATMETPTGTFINIVEALYNKSLGPWCIIERLSKSWLFGLHRGLGCPSHPYFNGITAVEDRHANIAIDTTCLVLETRPLLADIFLYDAEMVARALTGVWDDMLAAVR